MRGKRFLLKHSASGFHLQLCVFPTNADKYNNSCENADYFQRLIHWLLGVVWLCTDWWWPFKLKEKPSKKPQTQKGSGVSSVRCSWQSFDCLRQGEWTFCTSWNLPFCLNKPFFWFNCFSPSFASSCIWTEIPPASLLNSCKLTAGIPAQSVTGGSAPRAAIGALRARNAALNPDACKCSQIYNHVGSDGVEQSMPDNTGKGHGGET